MVQVLAVSFPRVAGPRCLDEPQAVSNACGIPCWTSWRAWEAVQESEGSSVFFDCTLGYGKTRFSRTVVGARGPVGFGPAQHGPDLESERVDDWFIVFGSRRILTIEEIESLLSEL